VVDKFLLMKEGNGPDEERDGSVSISALAHWPLFCLSAAKSKEGPRILSAGPMNF
jgi:hypothetical protein